MRRILQLTTAGLAIALTLTGCVLPKTAEPSRTPLTSSSPDGAAAPAPTETAVAPAVAGGEDAPQSPGAPAPLDDAARVDAAARAAGFMTAFADHSVDAAAWFVGIGEYLSADAASVYRGSNGDRVAATQVTGEPVLEIATEEFVRANVPTDAGSYAVVMNVSAAGQWVVVRVMTPGS